MMQSDAIKDLKEVREKYCNVACGIGCSQCPLNIEVPNDHRCIFWIIEDLEPLNRYRVEVHSFTHVLARSKDDIPNMNLDVDDNMVITSITEVKDDTE